MLFQTDSLNSGTRRVKGRARRTQSIGTKLTEHEESAILNAAEQQGKSPSEWARETLLAAARPQDGTLFVEVQALRLLLVNSLEPLLRGEKMTPEQFKAMLQYVKTNKRKAAADMLATYAEGNTEQQ